MMSDQGTSSKEPMSCERVQELLPFLLNGSLKAREREEVNAHLPDCQECRQELYEAALVWAATGAHPPTEVVADYGLGLDVDFPRDLLEQHIAVCSECRTVLSAMDGHDSNQWLAPAIESAPTAGPVSGQISPGGWRGLAMAASVLSLLLSGVLLWQLAESSPTDTDLVVSELIAVENLVRGTDTEGTAIRRAKQTALILVPPRSPVGNEFRLTAFDPTGERALGIDGLQQSELGDFAVLLRTRTLRESQYRLVLEERTRDLQTGAADDWASLGEYALRLVGSR